MPDLNPSNIPQPNSSRRRGQAGKKIRLERLVVQNLKALDHLDIELPAPDSKADPDMFVMGSKNGLGKTSFLEACFIVFLASMAPRETNSFRLDVDLRDYFGSLFDLPGMIIRADAEQAELEGTFSLGQKAPVKIKVVLERNGKVTVEGSRLAFEKFIPLTELKRVNIGQAVSKFAYLLAGLNNDALIVPPYFYFHSYRRVAEGNLELRQLVGTNMHSSRSRFGVEPPSSIFKREMLQVLMSQGGVFEDLDDTEAGTTLVQLNNLMEQYAGGSIKKLRTSERGTVEFPIIPNSGGQSFTFDGLSSGQKEIISTLFLIWHYTKNRPGIVLIDEPELHLNAEWHQRFITSLYDLAPYNQYLIATHSEDIAASVDKDRRILLTQKVD